MSHQVLARKWRPGNFREMVGQEHVLKALINALDRDRLHHAYLFTGTRGVGKTTIARIFAKCLNCEQGLTSTPCGSCAACTEIDQGRFLDLIEVDAASRTKVEDTRELLENVQYAPSRGRFKVYLIDEVHMLSNHSFNALLKTLEEPPPHVKFLLATTDPQKLPATILSRCLQFSLKNMPSEQIVGHLQQVLEAEAIEHELAALWLLAEAARGSMRDALSLTDQAIGFGAGTLFERDVRSMLGTVDRHAVERLLTHIIAGDGAALFVEIENLSAMGTDFEALLRELIALLHAVAVEQAVPGVAPQGRVDSAQLAEFAGRLTGEDVQIFYQMALNGQRDFPYVPDPRRGFEMVALRLLTFRPLLEGEVELVGTGEQSVAAPAPAESSPDLPAGPVDGGTQAKKSEAPQGEPREVADAGRPGPQGGVAPAAVSAEGAPRDDVAEHASSTDSSGSVPVADALAAPSADAVAAPSADKAPTLEPMRLADFERAHWNRIFPALKLTGVTRNIAANAAPGSISGGCLHFILDAQQSLVFNQEHQQRWQAALTEYFGEAVELEVEIGHPPGETPAQCRERLKAERLAAAVRELEQDENVLMLQQRYGARLLTASVRPVDEA